MIAGYLVDAIPYITPVLAVIGLWIAWRLLKGVFE